MQVPETQVISRSQPACVALVRASGQGMRVAPSKNTSAPEPARLVTCAETSDVAPGG